MFKINKDYMHEKINSIYKKIFQVIPIKHILFNDLIKLAHNYYNDIKLLENKNTHDYDNIFNNLTDKFWKMLNSTIKYHIRINNNVYETWGFRIDEIILNEPWL